LKNKIKAGKKTIAALLGARLKQNQRHGLPS